MNTKMIEKHTTIHTQADIPEGTTGRLHQVNNGVRKNRWSGAGDDALWSAREGQGAKGEKKEA